MELVDFGITRKELSFEEHVVMPLGDIQLQQDRNAVDISLLKQTIQWGVDHNAWWVGMGDMVDMESPSNRRALASTGIYDSVMDALDAKAEELEEELQDILKPTVGRWFGLLEGHHFHPHQDGTTSDTRLAQYLKCPFLGKAAYINVPIKFPSKHGKRDVVFWAHHGEGGGSLAGSPLNKIEQVIKGFDADVYLMGHTHKSPAAPIDRVYPYFFGGRGTLHHKRMYLVSTGSYLKGYVAGHKRGGRAGGLYPEDKMMNPLPLGSPRIWLRPGWETMVPGAKSTIPKVDISVEI